MILNTPKCIAILSLILATDWVIAQGNSTHATPSAAHVDYLPDGTAAIPPSYRYWPFLSSGLDMAYPEEGAMTMSQHMFTNVFVDPDSMRSFQATGTWPDGAVLVKEDREGVTKGSINKTGKFQTTQLFGVEMHIKDSVRFPGGWAFFFSGGVAVPAQLLPAKASCYSCHRTNGAVDTTFVQFYPTLIDIAKAKGTLSAGYAQKTKANGEFTKKDP
jgi:hypothetical protein